MTFGMLLKKVRKEKGMLQKDIAKAVNMKSTKLSAIEKGKVAPTRQEMIDIFKYLLGVEE